MPMAKRLQGVRIVLPLAAAPVALTCRHGRICLCEPHGWGILTGCETALIDGADR